MDADRFDALARLVAAAPTRRGFLKGLAGMAALGVFAGRGRRAASFNDHIGLDLPFAVVRPTDLDAPLDSIYLDQPYTALFDPSLRPDLTPPGAFLDDHPIYGYRQRLVTPPVGGTASAGPESGGAVGRVYTTSWYGFDPSQGRVADGVHQRLVADYLGTATQLAFDPTIGDGASFHAWTGQLSDGRAYESLAGALAFENTLGVLRIDTYDGVPAEPPELERLLVIINGRRLAVQGADHQSPAIAVAPLADADASVTVVVNAAYYALDGALYNTFPRDDEAYARTQERLAEVEGAYQLIQPLPLGDAASGPSAAFAVGLEWFGDGEAADAYFRLLPRYLADDGPRAGFSAALRETAPDIGIDAFVADYLAQTDLGAVPGVQIALNTGETVARFNVRGGFPLPAGSEPTDDYAAVIYSLGTAAVDVYFARGFGGNSLSPEEVAASLGRAIADFRALQEQCLSGSPERCIAEQPLVAGGGTTESTGYPPLDLAGAVVPPPSVAELFDLDPADFVVRADYTFSGVEGARLAGVPDHLVDSLGDENATTFTGHTNVWHYGLQAPADADTAPTLDPNGVHVRTTIFGRFPREWEEIQAIFERFVAKYGGMEADVPDDALDLGFDDYRLFEGSGETSDGRSFATQAAIVRKGALVGELRLDDYGLEEDGPIIRDKLWIWGSYGRQEVDTPTVADAPLLDRLSWQIEQILDSDHRDLGTSFPPYANQIDDTDVFSGDFYLTGLFSIVAGGFSLAPVSFEGYDVVDRETVREAGKTDDQYNLARSWNQDIERAYSRVDYFTTGGHDLANPDDLSLSLNRYAALYPSAADAADAFAKADEKIAQSVAVTPGLEEVPDPERQTFAVDHRYYRYLVTDEAGQQAGVELAVRTGVTTTWFGAFGPGRLGHEHKFGEEYVDALNRVVDAAALDYAAYNQIDLGLGADEFDDLRGRLADDLARFFAGPDRFEARIERDPDSGGGGTSTGCPAGWTFDANGVLGRGCYRCSYPCLPGTTYDARQHVCVRGGRREHCTPKHTAA